MIFVLWRDPADEWFADWELNAKQATDEAIEAAQQQLPYKFDSKIWTALKGHLAVLFHNKCAYCEARIRHVMPGDIEHYRPKSEVTGFDDHPGYYWLAYAPSNLLLSCELCNRAGGKMNKFPISGVARMTSPDDANEEQPLLLHPYFDNPPEHLAFAPPVGGKPVGTISGSTVRGAATVTICRLDRPELDSERADAQMNIINALNVAVSKGEVGKVYKQLMTGEPAFSAACVVAAKQWLEDIKSEFT